MNKKDFPIFKNHPKLIYLDSAATSQKPRVVIDAVKNFYETTNAPIHRVLYSLGEQATKEYEAVRKKTADFLGARGASEVVFVKSATEGANLVAESWLRDHLKKGDEVLTTIYEHHSCFVPWQEMARKKKAIFKVGGEPTRQTKFFAFTLASNVTGEIFLAKKMICDARKRNPQIKIFVDAAQAVGRVPVNFKDLDADFLVASGHKFYAPTGAGILLIKKELHKEMNPFLLGGGMILSVSKEKSTWQKAPYLFEAGSPLTEAVVGLGAAIGYIQKIGLKKIRQHEETLIAYALEKLGALPSVHILGPREIKKKIGVISFYHEKIHAHDIASLLSEENIAVRAGHHCAMVLHKELGISASVRMSFSVFTEKGDIDKIVFALKKINETLGI